MRSLLALTILLCASIPAFSQPPFTLDVIGGTVNFGAAPMHIAVVSGTGTVGHVTPEGPPASISCKPAEAETLPGTNSFIILGTTTEYGHLWDIEFLFQVGTNTNLGNLSISSTTWKLIGKYVMTIKDTVTGSQCSAGIVGPAEKYQFAGSALAGWPHDCKNATNSPGQSPGLTGSMVLQEHPGAYPVFVAGGSCSAALAKQANSKIGTTSFKAADLHYKLTY
jgi:hypothetical protein